MDGFAGGVTFEIDVGLAYREHWYTISAAPCCDWRNTHDVNSTGLAPSRTPRPVRQRSSPNCSAVDGYRSHRTSDPSRCTSLLWDYLCSFYSLRTKHAGHWYG